MSGEARFDHLLLSQRKAFVLRWHAAAVEPEGGLRDDDGWEKALRAIAGACRPPRRDDDDEPLDRFVGLALDHRDISDPLACACHAALATLRARAGVVVCGECARSADEPAPCGADWQRNDRLAQAGGACIEPVHAAFRTATGLAAELYARTCGVAAAPVRLRTVERGMAAFAGVRPSVGGQVKWPAPGAAAGTPSVLQVMLDVAQFDRNGLKLLPYTLLHEAVCHLYQQVADPRRRNPRVYDAFAEGWMDFVAAELVAGTRGLGASEPPGPGPFDDAEAAGKALEFHARRHDSLAGDPFPNRGKVAQGRAAALAVLRLFRHDDGAPPGRADRGDAWDDFVALSCQLNAAAWSVEARASCLAGLPTRVRGGDPALADCLIAWRRRWWEADPGVEATLIAPVLAALLAPSYLL